MEEKNEITVMTTREAWADFYTWIRADKEYWKSLKKKDRLYLVKTTSEIFTGKKVGMLRVEKAFNSFAKGRYEPCVYWGFVKTEDK